jgi:hypothetical protein
LTIVLMAAQPCRSALHLAIKPRNTFLKESQSGPVPRRRVDPQAVFLNLPYDREFESLYLAYIVGLSALRLVPRVTLGIPGGERRLDRIFDLVRSCRYSIHDLSRVELDLHRPFTPRFNMPFELGLAVAWAKLNRASHTWFVCETKSRRALKSLSDLNGTDLQIHGGTAPGVMRELCSAFVRVRRQPSVPEMMEVYRALKRGLPEIQARAGAASLFEPRVFAEVSFAAATLCRRLLG